MSNYIPNNNPNFWWAEVTYAEGDDSVHVSLAPLIAWKKPADPDEGHMVPITGECEAMNYLLPGVAQHDGQWNAWQSFLYDRAEGLYLVQGELLSQDGVTRYMRERVEDMRDCDRMTAAAS